MKITTALAVALSSVAFAAPTENNAPWKDLTNLKYIDEMPVAKITKMERREASKPVRDNRNLHYNVDTKMPIAMAQPERREAAQAVKDNRNLHYNVETMMPIAVASPKRREFVVEDREASQPLKDNRNLHYNANEMPIAVSD